MTFPVVYTPEPTEPSGGPMPGAKALLSFAIDEFDVAEMGDEIHSLGIYNPRDVCGNDWPHWKCAGSQHARGAAGDAGVPVQRPEGHSEGHRLAAWLVANHEALGVQEVIFAGKRWSNQTLAWKKYTGRSDHFDHVHFALNDPAAQGLTMPMIQALWQTPEDDLNEIQDQRLLNVEKVGINTETRVGHVEKQLDDLAAKIDKLSAGGGASAAALADEIAKRLNNG